MAPLHTFEARKARTARPRVVAAVLCHRALGDRFICIFVDNRLLQLGEAEQVVSRSKKKPYEVTGRQGPVRLQRHSFVLL